jgi:AcrR family transcriptional regulator
VYRNTLRYPVKVGRPREHNEETRAALRAAAERLLTEGGPAAFSVRAVAHEAGTTTRAVYSLFGSKDGLLVDALAQSAFEFLFTEIDELPVTDDAVSDLLDVGRVFRRLVIEHPAWYRIAFQRVVPGLDPGPELTAARDRAWAQLGARVQRVADMDLLGDKPVSDARVEYNAMLEGLANAELRGTVFPNLPAGREDEVWRAALATVVGGFVSPKPDSPLHAEPTSSVGG